MTVRTRLQYAARDLLGLLGVGAAARDLLKHGIYCVDRKTRSRNTRFKNSPGPDGLPMPPPELVYLVTGQFDAEVYYQSGMLGAQCIREVLSKQGLDLNSFGTILDFGCGCGRILRHWRKPSGPKLWGVDYNPRLIDWCRRNLTFAEFAVNTSATNLPFREGTFDFIYSISVFTHLTEPEQRFWMNELTRVLKPGGHLLFTVHGTTRLAELWPWQRQAFESGKFVIANSRHSGTNFCCTYNPEPYVRDVLCQDLRFVAFEPGAAKDANQDVFLLQKPIASSGE
ncbi:MAG: class I SAM-dependent methyltransferase [Terriglobia bacterium]